MWLLLFFLKKKTNNNNIDNCAWVIIVLHFLSQFPGDKPSEDAAYFVPTPVVGPFEVLVLGSDPTKGLAVTDIQDKRVTIEKLQDDRSATNIVIYRAWKI